MSTIYNDGVNLTENTGLWSEVKSNVKMLGSWRYYKEQMSGWSQGSYWLMFFAWGMFLMQFLMGHQSKIEILSFVGSITGFACVSAIKNNRQIEGVVGIVSNLAVAWLAISTTAYADALMQLFYFAVLSLPMVFLGKKWQERKIHDTTAKEYLILTVLFIVLFGALYYSDSYLIVSHSPLFDAFTGATGLTASFAMLMKTRFQSIFWIIQGVASLVLYADLLIKGAPVTGMVVMYSLYLLNNAHMVSFSQWKLFGKKTI